MKWITIIHVPFMMIITYFPEQVLGMVVMYFGDSSIEDQGR